MRLHRSLILVASLLAAGCGSSPEEIPAGQEGSLPAVDAVTEVPPDTGQDLGIPPVALGVVPKAIDALPPDADAADFVSAVRSDSSCADAADYEFEPTASWMGYVERWIRLEGVTRQIQEEELPSDVVLGAKVPLEIEISDPLSGERSQMYIGIHRDYMPMIERSKGVEGVKIVIGVTSYGTPYNVAHVVLAVSETDVAFGGRCGTDSLTLWFESRFDGQVAKNFDGVLALTGDALQTFLDDTQSAGPPETVPQILPGLGDEPSRDHIATSVFLDWDPSHFENNDSLLCLKSGDFLGECVATGANIIGDRPFTVYRLPADGLEIVFMSNATDFANAVEVAKLAASEIPESNTILVELDSVSVATPASASVRISECSKVPDDIQFKVEDLC